VPESDPTVFGCWVFISDDKFVILTNGFAKKSQKTPKKEIKLAEQRKADYLSRKGGKQ